MFMLEWIIQWNLLINYILLVYKSFYFVVFCEIVITFKVRGSFTTYGL
jgi:hypothetical protein